MEPVFFPPRGGPLRLADIAEIAGTAVPDGAPDLAVDGVASLEEAGPGDLSYMDNARYAGALSATRAGLCLVSARFAAKVPAGTLGAKRDETRQRPARVAASAPA